VRRSKDGVPGGGGDPRTGLPVVEAVARGRIRARRPKLEVCSLSSLSLTSPSLDLRQVAAVVLVVSGVAVSWSAPAPRPSFFIFFAFDCRAFPWSVHDKDC
jgi:hypothetical protein